MRRLGAHGTHGLAHVGWGPVWGWTLALELEAYISRSLPRVGLRSGSESVFCYLALLFSAYEVLSTKILRGAKLGTHTPHLFVSRLTHLRGFAASRLHPPQPPGGQQELEINSCRPGLSQQLIFPHQINSTLTTTHPLLTMAGTPICPCASCFGSTSQHVSHQSQSQQRHQQQQYSFSRLWKSKTGGSKPQHNDIRPTSAASTLVGWPADAELFMKEK